MDIEIGTLIKVLVGAIAALGGQKVIKLVLFMNSEKRKAKAEADIKEVEKEEKKLGVMEQLIKSLKERIEQQDKKIKELNDRLDKLYEKLHEQERENNALVRENNELKLALKEAEYNVCVRPDDECFKGRLPKRTYCRLKKLAAGDYDAFYDDEEKEKKNNNDENNGIPEKSN